MESGFVLDLTHGGRLVPLWHRGAPHTSFWAGVKHPDDQGLPIGVYRCTRCGYLESYASEQFAPQ